MIDKVTATADKIVSQLISSLNESERMILLPLIIKKLEEIVDDLTNQGEIVSAVPLDEKYIQSVEKILEKKINKKVVLKNKVDKHIFGGLIIRYKDMVIDQSIKRHLNDIKEKVYEA